MIRFTVLLAMVFTMVLATVGTTQEKEKKLKGQLPAGWKDLGLSIEQKAKVYTLQTEYKGKIVKLQQEIKALQTQEKSELVKVLTPEQKSQLAKALVGEIDVKKSEKKEKEEKK